MARDTRQTAQQLLEVTMLAMRSLAAEMRQNEPGLTPVHVGLLAKIDAGECNMSDLARHQSVRLPTISKSIKLLVERGWVERWVPEDNRRQTMVRLTREGRQALAAMKRRAENHVARLLQPLSNAEHERVSSALKCLGETLKSSTVSDIREEMTS